MQILHVAGARPNFMKVAPVMRALKALKETRQTLVHTGQHYDFNMSDIFFQDLEIPKPEVNLGVETSSHAGQTAQIMTRLEPYLLQSRPDWVFVYGDVNSTVAAAFTATQLGIAVAHVEAGLRSWDRTMPEEINRVLTDQISDLLFTPSREADENLKREGMSEEKIHFVGNVMIDTLVSALPRLRKPALKIPDRFVLVTLHRPSNVDDPENLESILATLDEISRQIPVLFPVHPRTREKMKLLSFDSKRSKDFLLLNPQSYLEFLYLEQKAELVITDSGGIQEETTYLGIPCLTFRKNTERPVTETEGTNRVVGEDARSLGGEVERVLSGRAKKGKIPVLWDGKAAERIAAVMEKLREKGNQHVRHFGHVRD